MQIDILTLFPQMFTGPFDFSIVKKAQQNSGLTVNLQDLRQWSTNNYQSVDDRPYGGGAGMIMRVDIIDSAVSHLKSQSPQAKVILLDATGEKFTQKKAQELSGQSNLIIICGHYEGVDHRVHEHLADEVISIGDYVLSGGEIPAMVLVDSIARLLPGALGNPESLQEESHLEESVVEYPQYTRPEDYKGWKVPEVLLSGNHAQITKWRKSSGSEQ
ncbi:MAG: tRNA (guanosine(37)-N1)-methyltransferase TrmD [bacterium]|nr:tRNA (guanosine(37)-N1)-methyltransferase TrmD [bacterium]